MRIAGPILFFILTLFWGATASADHMTGRYQGTGAIAGDVLDLRQSGTALQGTITGNDQGTLQGQTDGGNNAQGTIQLAQPGRRDGIENVPDRIASLPGSSLRGRNDRQLIAAQEPVLPFGPISNGDMI